MSTTIRFDFGHLMALYRLDELKQYLHVTEKYLHKAKTDFKAWSDEQVKELPREQYDEYQDFHQDEYWRYEEKFPRILRNSFLVSAHSLLEYEINVICRRIEKEQQIPISWKDLKGDILGRTKSYCKLARLDLPVDDPTWQEIDNYYKVRNCIVHNNGLIEGARKEKTLRDYITRKKIVSEDTIEEEIALTAPFCEEVINTMKDFLDKVYKTILITKETRIN